MPPAVPTWPSAEQFVDDLLAWFAHTGFHRYDESVTQLEHGLQSALRSLKLQGGLLPAEEVAQMEAEPSLDRAVALRRRDDAAKIPGREVPGLETYRELLVRLVAAR